MTNQEAIEILKTERNHMIPTLLPERIDAMDMAISALEKQIPKQLRITTSTKRCATCGRQLSGIGNIHPTRNYCQRCGQAICWEEE